ncbi:MAG: hypothetical protein AAGH46_10600 [Bacteroidota bacterium]
MRRVKTLLLLCPILFLACDDEDLLDFLEDPEIDVTTNFVFSFDVASPQLTDPNERVSFSNIQAIDILSNPQISEEIGEPERIKKVVINSVTYEFKNFSGNVDADVRGFLGFPGPDAQDQNFEMQEVNAAESDLFVYIYTLNGDFTGISARVTELTGIGCVYLGSSSHNPIDFTLEVIVNATVTLELNVEDL